MLMKCYSTVATTVAIEEGWRQKQNKGRRVCLGEKFIKFHRIKDDRMEK